MIPDEFPYFFDDFWNFQNLHQIWTRAPRIHHQNTSTNTRKYGNIIKQYFSSHHFGNPKFPDLWTPLDIKNVEPINLFVYFSQNLVGSKHLAPPSLFKEFVGGGSLINFGIPKNMTNLKA